MAIYTANDVPLLDLSSESKRTVERAHAKAMAAWEAATGEAEPIQELLLGHRVFVHNKAPLNAPDRSDVTAITIGAASLDEALKDVIGSMDRAHLDGGDVLFTPDWVSSTDLELSALLAEHYTRKQRNDFGPPSNCASIDVSEVVVYRPPNLQATRVAVGRDIESAASFQFASMYHGNSTTAPTSTTFTTDGVNIPVNSVVGQYIVRLDATSGNRVFGIIQSNTSAANSVLTIDRWYNPSSLPGNRGVAAPSAPAAGGWAIMPGNVPAAYIGLTANAGAAGDGDTTLTGEITTVGGGLIRQLATYAHTAAGTTSSLTNTWTANGTDSLPVTIAKIGSFQGVEAASRMFFESLLTPTTATLSASTDQLQVVDTVTL